MALVKVEFGVVNEAGATGAVGRVRQAFLNLGSATGRSTEGLGQVRRGLELLAFQATGVEGPLGRVGAGLLTFSAGSTVMLSVAAGIAGVGLLYNKLTQDVSAAEKKTADFTKSLEAQAEALKTVGQRLQDVLAGLKSGQSTITGLAAGARAFLESGTFPGANFLFGDLIDVLERYKQEQLDIAGVNAVLATSHLRAAQAEHNRAEETKKLAQAQRDLLDALASIQGGINLGAIQAEVAGIGKLPLLTKGAPNLSAITGDKVPLLTKNLVDLGAALDRSADAAAAAARAHQQAAIQIINAVAGLAALAASGGSAGGFLAGIGGIVGLFNPIAGAIVGGIGGILLASESNEERRHGELLKALEPIGELVFFVTEGSFGSAEALDSFVRRAEQATNRRVTVRYGGR